jgi:hypothetical protein
MQGVGVTAASQAASDCPLQVMAVHCCPHCFTAAASPAPPANTLHTHTCACARAHARTRARTYGRLVLQVAAVKLEARLVGALWHAHKVAPLARVRGPHAHPSCRGVAQFVVLRACQWRARFLAVFGTRLRALAAAATTHTASMCAARCYAPYSPVCRPTPPIVKDLTSVCW